MTRSICSTVLVIAIAALALGACQARWEAPDPVATEFKALRLEAGGSIDNQCIAWHPAEQALDVHAVSLVTGHGWGTSRWFLIPAAKLKGKNGYFDCASGGINPKKPHEADATTLFVQDVQPVSGTPQRFELGRVVKIEPGQALLGIASISNSTKLPIESGVKVDLHVGDPVSGGHRGNYWMPADASTMARDVDALYYGILGLSLFFFFGIAAAVIYFCWKYRWRPGRKPEPSVAHNDALEITWTVIPSIIVVIIFVLGWRGYINLATPPRHALEIKVTAQKWAWLFEHPAVDGEVVSDNVLHVPVNRPVRVVMRSKDVIHSFFIPAFRVKQDIVPGRYTKLWFTPTKPGVYRLFCAEYCGLDHSQMKTQVVVHPPGGYERYIAQQIDIQSNIPPAQLGKKLYTQRGCAGCHSLDGSPMSGPSFKGLFGKTEALRSGSVNVDENYLRESILDPTAKIVRGFQPVMPSFKGQLSDKQLDGLIEYIKTIK